ncbi:MAG: MFS transporter [Pseudolysinimonas sp.]|uniref:MFS transporter n=1 Tax=Pseudolysinimonas sp. TaxID=2680009 RepID=UPI003264AA16
MAQTQKLGAAFGNIFTANLSSSLADGIARTAAPLLAVQLTSDPLLIAGIAALQMLPWLLFAIPAGLIVDSVDRRRALAIANTLRALLGVGLFVLAATGTLTILWLYVVIFLYGVGETVYDGAIRAVVPSIVPKALLPRANGRIEAAEVVVQNFAAAPITSALFAVTVLIPLGVNAAAFALAAALALALPAVASGRQFATPKPEVREPWHQQLAEGFRFIFGRRMLVILLFLSTFIGLCFSAATASFVLFLVDDLGLPAPLFGLFLVTGAFGGLAASLLVAPLAKRFGSGRTMAVANLVGIVPLLVIGLLPSIWVAAVGYFFSSLGVTTWNVLVISLRQSIIPGRLLGRVHGSWRTVLWGSMPLGALIGGLLGRIDLAVPFIAGGGAATIAGILFFRFISRLPNPEDVDNGDAAPPIAEAGPTDPTVLE